MFRIRINKNKKTWHDKEEYLKQGKECRYCRELDADDEDSYREYLEEDDEEEEW